MYHKGMIHGFFLFVRRIPLGMNESIVTNSEGLSRFPLRQAGSLKPQRREMNVTAPKEKVPG